MPEAQEDAPEVHARELLEGVQLVDGGPDVPLRLMKAQEKGELVFFCGAGVSAQAGLPTFSGLVKRLRDGLGAGGDARLRELIEHKAWEEAIRHLFNRYEREEILALTRTNLTAPEGVRPKSHEALIELATDEQGAHRIVTTNFDDLFDRTKFGTLASAGSTAAPLLPVPKREKWAELVYIHGRFTADGDDADSPETIVFSPADFGTAYLLERWAARFVTELFRNFTVVFVGYGADDVMIRYLIDAIAADRLADPLRAKPVYAFADYDVQSAEWSRDQVWSRWMERSVLPILFDTTERGFAPLHETLWEWARLVGHGLDSKAGIVRRLASLSPTRLPRFERTRFYWAVADTPFATLRALRHSEDAPGEVFLHPDWLDQSMEGGGRNTVLDLIRGRTSDANDPDKGDACLSALIHGGWHAESTRLHPIQCALAELLACSIRNTTTAEATARRVAELGGRLHPQLTELVVRDLDGARIPGEHVRRFWRGVTGILPLSTGSSHRDLYDVLQVIRRTAKEERKAPASDRWYSNVRLQLLSCLEPKLHVERHDSVHLALVKSSVDVPSSVRHLAKVSIHIGDPDVNREVVFALMQLRGRRELIFSLAEHLSNTLCRSLEALEFLDHAHKDDDYSYIHRPSLDACEPHEGSGMWTVVVDMLVKALELIRPVDRPTGQRLVRQWIASPFPIFRRLTLFAAERRHLFTPLQMLRTIKERPRDWLWLAPIRRELLSYLPHFWTGLNERQRDTFVHLLRQGPPREQFRPDLSDEDVKEATEHAIWSRARHVMNKVPEDTAHLQPIVEDIENRRPDLRKVRVDAEPLFHVSTRWHQEPTDYSAEELASRPPSEVATILVSHETNRAGLLETWTSVASSNQPHGAAVAEVLVGEAPRRVDMWEATIRAFRTPESEDLALRFLHCVHAINTEVYANCRRVLADFLLGASRFKIRTEKQLDVWDALKNGLAVEPRIFKDADALTAAINATGGVLTLALVDGLDTSGARREQGIPLAVAQRLEWCVSGQNPQADHARAIVGSRIYLLYWLDSEWSTSYALPLFDLGSSSAIPVWQGFFYNARVSPSLWGALKANFLRLIEVCDQLGPIADEPIPHFVTSMAIDGGSDALSEEESRYCLTHIGGKRRGRAAWAVWKKLDEAGEKAGALWSDRIGPWLHASWPREKDAKSPDQAKFLALAALAAGEAMTEAVSIVAPFMCPIERPNLLCSTLEELVESGIEQSDAAALLMLIGKTTPRKLTHSHRRICEIIRRIESRHPSLATHRDVVSIKKRCQEIGM